MSENQEVLYTLDEPHITIGDTLIPPTIGWTTLENNLIILSSEVLEPELSFDFTIEQTHLKNILYVVLDLIKNSNILVSKIEHNLFHEIYHFTQANNVIRTKIIYDKTNKITGINAIEANELAKSTETLLKPIEGKRVILENEKISDEPPNMKDFGFPQPFMQEFYEFVNSKVSGDNIVVTNIDQSIQWVHRYYFSKGASTAVVNFHYSKKNQFKKNTPQPTLGNSSELLTQIIHLLFPNG